MVQPKSKEPFSWSNANSAQKLELTFYQEEYHNTKLHGGAERLISIIKN